MVEKMQQRIQRKCKRNIYIFFLHFDAWYTTSWHTGCLSYRRLQIGLRYFRLRIKILLVSFFDKPLLLKMRQKSSLVSYHGVGTFCPIIWRRLYCIIFQKTDYQPKIHNKLGHFLKIPWAIECTDRDSVVVLAGYWYARKPEITAGKISLSAHNVNVTSSHESDIDLSNGYHTWEHSPRRCSFKSL